MRTIDLEDHVAHELARASYIPQRRWLGWLTIALAVLTALTALLLLLMHWTLWAVLVVGLLALVSGGVLGYYQWRFRRDSRRRGQLQAGLAGQRLLPQVLATLDDSYYLINNLNLPGRTDDIDHLLVGPNGVFAIETKHHRGRIYWRDGVWYQSKMSRQGNLQPETAIRDPAQQLKRNIDYLRSCINGTDRDLSRRTRLWIEGIAVFTHPGASLDLPPKVIDDLPFPVIRVRDLPGQIHRHVPHRPLGKSQVRQIVSLFSHLKAPRSGYY